jgi:Putative addiction module component
MRDMGMAFEELEKQARSLSTEEKATLARILIEELDTAIDPNAEQLWLEEAQRRYEAFLKGELEARPGDEVMQRARDRLGSMDNLK